MRTAIALLRSAHALPTLAVTSFAVAVAADAGSAVALVAVAVLAGQLSIGWSNDYVDRGRDRASGRADKPLVRGELPDRVVGGSALAALVVTGAAGFTMGAAAGVANAVAVSAGWAYNLGLKATPLSPVPYALHFGIIPPLLVALALPDPGAPPLRLMAVSALLGVSAHFVNVVPDVAEDRRAGVLGLPQRMGAGPSAIVSAVLLVGATALLMGVPETAAEAALTFVGIGSAAGFAVAVAGPRPIRDRRAFALNIVAVAVVVASFFAGDDVLAGVR